jgi:hypothetical protein
VRMQLKPGDKTPVGTQFTWDVIQLAPRSENATPSPIGGERYILTVPKKGIKGDSYTLPPESLRPMPPAPAPQSPEPTKRPR